MQTNLKFCRIVACLFMVVLSGLCVRAQDTLRVQETMSISQAVRNEAGVLTHHVQSIYQSATTQIHVLQPDQLEKGRKYRVIYLLPVEAGKENRYGDGMEEVRSLGLHNAHGVIFVAPTFAHLPWYADHPTDPAIRQESHFLKVVVPFIDRTYPVQADASGRYLLGFSKSGWGAWTMLLRHQDTFGKAVAWDAPLMMDQLGKYGSGPIFGTVENFAHYQLSNLLNASSKRNQTERNQTERNQMEHRLIMLGYGNFRAEHVKLHELMDQWQIAHLYRDGPFRKHDWHSGWVKEAVELLTK